MATREENLKKIHDELEKLSDDELDSIAGGMIKPFIDNQQPDSATENLQTGAEQYQTYGCARWNSRTIC